MDLNLINVLPQGKASSPSFSNCAPVDKTKPVFADVLSAQPQAQSAHDSDPAAKTATSKVSGLKQDSEKKDKGAKQVERDSKQAEAAPTAVSPVPAQARAVPVEIQRLSFFPCAPTTAPDLSEASRKAVNSKGEKSVSTPGLTQAPVTSNHAQTRIAVLPQASKGSPSSADGIAQTHVAGDQSSAVRHQKVPESTRVEASLQNGNENEVPGSNDSPKPEIPASGQAPAGSIPSAAHLDATTAPADFHSATEVKPEATIGAKAAVAGDDKNAPTNATPSTVVAPDQAISTLVAAAEKVGAVVSTAQSNNSKPAARPAGAATKTAISQAKTETTKFSKSLAMGAVVSDGHPITAHPANKQENSAAQASTQDASSDIKPATADATAKEPVSSGATSGKDGAAAVATTAPHSSTAQSRDGITSGSTAAASPDAPPHRDANSLPTGRENSLTGAEISGLSKASLIERFRQSEMRFGMQSGEFGRIEVRTLLDHHEVTARISVERGDLSRALESELPGLQKRLSDLDGPAAKITLYEQSSAMSMSGESGRRPRTQEWQSSQPAPSLRIEPALAAATLGEAPIATEGLSIRI